VVAGELYHLEPPFKAKKIFMYIANLIASWGRIAGKPAPFQSLISLTPSIYQEYMWLLYRKTGSATI
jgi:hypothetical protein